MEEKDVKNTLDSAQPKAAGAARLSEDEKKELELSALMEHAQGEQKHLHEQVQEIEEKGADE